MLHRYDKRVFYLNEDQFLNFQALQRIMIDYNVFSNTLHCVYLIVFLVLNKVHFSKRSSADQLQNFEIVKYEFWNIVNFSRFLVPRVNGLCVGIWWRQLRLVLAIDAGLPPHCLLLVLNVLHDDISVIIEDIMPFVVCFNFEAFKLHFGMNFCHFFIWHYVLVIQSGKSQRNSRVSFLNIFFSCDEIG